MSKEQMARAADDRETRGEAQSGDDAREELQRRVGEARDSIAQTVTEIKETVTDKYESVKEGIEDALDWREQFRSHPVAWAAGALAVGYVVGQSVSAALRGEGEGDRLLSHLSSLAGRFADELSEQGMHILTPVLSGAVLVPILVDKVGELSGLDLSALAAQLSNQDGGKRKGAAKGKKKKGGAKKQGKKAKKAKRAGPA